jgi:hypothetical protein
VDASVDEHQVRSGAFCGGSDPRCLPGQSRDRQARPSRCAEELTTRDRANR